jgi:hypothetical protein
MTDLTLEAIVFSESDTVVTSAAPYASSTPIQARVFSRITLPNDAMVLSGGVIAPAVHLSAPDAFTVTAVNAAAYSVDTFLVTPEAQLGTSYLVTSYPGHGPPFIYGQSAFAIVAIQDGTTVTITTTEWANNDFIPPFSPTQIALDRGDAFQVLVSVAAGDLTASTVVADAPVAVFGASTCAYVPTTTPGTCDHTVEQMPPTPVLGSELVTMASVGRDPVGDHVRIVASQNSTTVAMDPSPSGCCPPLDAGQWFEVEVVEPTHITANQPILTARFAPSAISNPHPPPYVVGDPFHAEVPPENTFSNRHPFFIDNFGGGAEFAAFIDVVTTSTGCVILDGRRIPPTTFDQVGVSQYFAASIAVEPGRHVLDSEPAAGVTVYGFALAEGFGTTAPGYPVAVDCGLFLDDFETGGTSHWSATIP